MHRLFRVYDRLIYWWWEKHELPKFYHHVRALCRPPMVLLEELEIGELWFYDYAARILACVDEDSVIIAYYLPSRGRDEVIASLIRIDDWLLGDAPRPSRGELNLGLAFAAVETSDGKIHAAEYVNGDWRGLFGSSRLPDHESGRPRNWQRNTDVPAQPCISYMPGQSACEVAPGKRYYKVIGYQ